MPPDADVAPLVFSAVGVPAPQGSKTRTQHGMKDDNAKTLKPWRATVAAAALEAVNARGGGPLWARGEAVTVFAMFWLPVPQWAEKLLERGLPTAPTSYPDSDKLARAVGDSLSDALVWADDGQADWGWIRRQWAWRHPPGVDVEVRSRDWGCHELLTVSAPTGLCHLRSVGGPDSVAVCGRSVLGGRVPADRDRPCKRCADVAERYGWPVVGRMARLFGLAGVPSEASAAGLLEMLAPSAGG